MTCSMRAIFWARSLRSRSRAPGTGVSTASAGRSGRTTSTIAWFKEGWPEFENPDYQAGGKSAALLEMRAVMHRYPARGDAYVYAPAMVSANSYTREFIHNLLDPVTGESWVSMQASGCKFDLTARKLLKTTPEELAVLERGMVKGLTA